MQVPVGSSRQPGTSSSYGRAFRGVFRGATGALGSAASRTVQTVAVTRFADALPSGWAAALAGPASHVASWLDGDQRVVVRRFGMEFEHALAQSKASTGLDLEADTLVSERFSIDVDPDTASLTRKRTGTRQGSPLPLQLTRRGSWVQRAVQYVGPGSRSDLTTNRHPRSNQH